MEISQIESMSPQRGQWDVKYQLKAHVYARSLAAFAKGDADRDAIRTPADLEQRVNRLRAAFIENLGGLPPMDTPLNPRLVGTVQEDGFRIEKIIFESRPGAYVTANLYVPDGIKSPRGAVLFLSGHHMLAKVVEEYQIVCRYFVKAGLVVLSQDPVGQGERFSYYEKGQDTSSVRWGTYEHDYAGWQSQALGDSIGRYFVHDAMRGIDYLTSRPEVDANRIGVTGNSGGGTQTCLMMACDPRIAAAAPTTFIMNRQTYLESGQAQDQEQIWPGMSALGFDHEDVLLLQAPKPVRVLAVTSDFFPIEGTRRTVARCKRIWEMMGHGDRLDMVEDFSTHMYTRPLARAATEFFTKHLLGATACPPDSEVEPIDPQLLICTESGQVRGDKPEARFVYQENQDRLAVLESQRSQVPDAEMKDRALIWLRGKVFDGRNPCDHNPRFYHSCAFGDLNVEYVFWWSETGIINYATCFRHSRYDGRDLPVTITQWDGGCSVLEPHLDWIRQTCESGRAVMVLNVRGDGDATPYQIADFHPLSNYGIVYKLTCDLIWLSDSLAAGRVYDCLRALDLPAMWPGLSIDDTRFYCHGRHCVYPRMAAALDSRIREVEWVEGLESYAGWVRSQHYEEHDITSIVFPGILQYMDLPDADRWAKAR